MPDSRRCTGAHCNCEEGLVKLFVAKFTPQELEALDGAHANVVLDSIAAARERKFYDLREDYWFVGGLLMALILGIVAGASLNVFFLTACSFLLAVVWIGVFFYTVFNQPRPFAVWLFLAIPQLLGATWLAVIVSMRGFWR